MEVETCPGSVSAQRVQQKLRLGGEQGILTSSVQSGGRAGGWEKARALGLSRPGSAGDRLGGDEHQKVSEPGLSLTSALQSSDFQFCRWAPLLRSVLSAVMGNTNSSGLPLRLPLGTGSELFTQKPGYGILICISKNEQEKKKEGKKKKAKAGGF